MNEDTQESVDKTVNQTINLVTTILAAIITNQGSSPNKDDQTKQIDIAFEYVDKVINKLKENNKVDLNVTGRWIGTEQIGTQDRNRES